MLGYTLVTGVCVYMQEISRGGEGERELFGSKLDCLFTDPFVVRSFVLTEQQMAEERRKEKNVFYFLFIIM